MSTGALKRFRSRFRQRIIIIRKIITVAFLGLLLSPANAKDALTATFNPHPMPESMEVALRANKPEPASKPPSKHWIAEEATYWGLDDWVMDLLNLVLLVANGYLIFMVKGQLHWMRRAVEVAEHEGQARDKADRERQAFEKSRLRARITLEVPVASVEIIPPFHSGNQNGRLSVRINPIIRNVGGTAAEAVEFIPRMYGEKQDVSNTKAMIEEDVNGRHLKIAEPYTFIENSPRTVSVGETVTQVKGQEGSVRRDGFDGNDSDVPLDYLVYAGLIKYRDIFNDIWVRKFIWYIIFKRDVRDEVLNVVEFLNEESRDDAWPKDV